MCRESRTLVAALLMVGLLQGCVYKVIYDAATGKGDFYPVKVVDTQYEPETQNGFTQQTGQMLGRSSAAECRGHSRCGIANPHYAGTCLPSQAVMCRQRHYNTVTTLISFAR